MIIKLIQNTSFTNLYDEIVSMMKDYIVLINFIFFK